MFSTNLYINGGTFQNMNISHLLFQVKLNKKKRKCVEINIIITKCHIHAIGRNWELYAIQQY